MKHHPFLLDPEIELINSYRTETGFQHGFVVIVSLPVSLEKEDAPITEITGWKLHLDNPQGFLPGVVAVDSNFLCWEAVDGDDYNGAKKWIPLLHQETKQYFHGSGGAA